MGILTLSNLWKKYLQSIPLNNRNSLKNWISKHDGDIKKFDICSACPGEQLHGIDNLSTLYKNLSCSVFQEMPYQILGL